MNISYFDLAVIILIVAVSLTLFLLKCLRKNSIVISILFFLLYLLSITLKLLFLTFIVMTYFFILFVNLAYFLFLIFYFRNKRLNITNFNSHYINPIIENEYTINLEKMPFIFFGIYNLINFDLYEKNIKIQSITADLNYNSDIYTFKTIINRHGFFDVKNVSVVFRDIFGFTEYKYKTKIIFNLTVHPFWTEAIQIPFLLEKGGDEIIQSINKINSTDFFENRKYFPGDDIRRINWKVFAHINELHIREIEKIPPKVGQITLFFAPYSKNIYEHELITSLFVSTASLLLRYGLEIKVKTTFNEQDITINKTNEIDFFNIVNNSYLPFDSSRCSLINNSIVFATYEEFVKILDYDMMKNSFCAVSLFKNSVNLKDLSLIYKIDKFDNIFLEIYNRFNLLIKNNDREITIERIKNIIDSKNIKLLLYETTGKDFEEYNQV